MNRRRTPRAWTRSRLKRELKLAFETPAPRKKEAFLNRWQGGAAAISLREFFCIQIKYISRWTWFFALAVFGLELWVGIMLGDRAMGAVSASMPFLALALVMENGRSVRHNMEELEFATRFSLKNVLLARMGILMGFHAVLLAALLVWSVRGSTFCIALGGLYILTPYFVTVCFGITLLRRFHSRETGYAYIGFSMLFCAVLSFMWTKGELFCGGRALKWWAAALVSAIFAIVKESWGFYRENRIFKTEG